MLNCINYGCGLGCGHNVCLCINLLLPLGLKGEAGYNHTKEEIVKHTGRGQILPF